MRTERAIPTTIFIAHEPEHVSLASAVLDLIEESVATSEGCVACSGVPGYPSDLSQVLEYRRDAASPISPQAMIIGLPPSKVRSQVIRDLQRAQAAGVQVIVLTDGAQARLEQQFPGATRLSLDKAGLTALVEDVAYSLRTRPRMSEDAREAMEAVVDATDVLAASAERTDDSALTPLKPLPPVAVPEPLPRAASAPQSSDRTDVTAPAARAVLMTEQLITDQALANATANQHDSPTVQGMPVYDDDLMAYPGDVVELDDDDQGPRAGRGVSTPPPLPEPSSAPSQSQAVPRPPISAGQCVEAGIDLCDCLFAELDKATATIKLQTHFATFFAGIGGDFGRLAKFATDDDDWLAAVDDRIEALPAERHWLGHWYASGYQLAILCNLASLPAGSAPSDVLAEAWGDFCAAASGAGMGEDLLTAIRASLQAASAMGEDPRGREDCLSHLRERARRFDEHKDAQRAGQAAHFYAG